MKPKYKIGDKIKLTSDALENYGEGYKNTVLEITHIATSYMPAKEYYAKGQPSSYHPGFDSSAKSTLYDFKNFPNSLYKWEMKKV